MCPAGPQQLAGTVIGHHPVPDRGRREGGSPWRGAARGTSGLGARDFRRAGGAAPRRCSHSGPAEPDAAPSGRPLHEAGPPSEQHRYPGPPRGVSYRRCEFSLRRGRSSRGERRSADGPSCRIGRRRLTPLPRPDAGQGSRTHDGEHMPTSNVSSGEFSREATQSASGIVELLDVMWEQARESTTTAPASTSQLRLMYLVDLDEGIRMRTLCKRLAAAPPPSAACATACKQSASCSGSRAPTADARWSCD